MLFVTWFLIERHRVWAIEIRISLTHFRTNKTRMESRFYFARETEDTRTINSAGFKLPKETLCWSPSPAPQRWNVSPVGKVTFHKMNSRQFPWRSLGKTCKPWPMPGQCYVTPVAKRLINASLFQSSLRRKWSGSTSTNPDKAISLLYTVFSVLQGMSKRGDDLSLFSLFSISFTAQCFSLFLLFLAPTTRLFCLAS